MGRDRPSRSLSVWFPELLTDARTALVVSGGGENARLAPLIERWLSDVDSLGPRRVLFVRDRDELDAAEISKLTGLPSVHVLESRELENYLLAPEALESVLRDQGRWLDGHQDMAGLMRTAADDLKSSVTLKRVARRLGRTIYGD